MSEIDSIYRKSSHVTLHKGVRFENFQVATINSYHSWKRFFENIGKNYSAIGGSENLGGQVEFQLVVDERTSGPDQQYSPTFAKERPLYHVREQRFFSHWCKHPIQTFHGKDQRLGKWALYLKFSTEKKMGVCFSVWTIIFHENLQVKLRLKF